MSTRFLLCGYAFHTGRFTTTYRPGLPMYLIRLQSEGRSRVVVNGRRIGLGPGDLLLLKPGDRYELSTGEERRGRDSLRGASGDYHVMCESGWMREWWQRSEKPAVSRVHIDETLLSLWRLLIVEKRRPASEGRSEEIVDQLLRALCLSLERCVAEAKRPNGYPGSVVRMLRFIEEHATAKLCVDEVARYVDLSASRAAHLFKAALGRSIMGYAQEIRLAVAMEQMKHTSASLDLIASSCGFGSYSYFHRVFRKSYGVAPGAFRRGR